MESILHSMESIPSLFHHLILLLLTFIQIILVFILITIIIPPIFVFLILLVFPPLVLLFVNFSINFYSLKFNITILRSMPSFQTATITLFLIGSLVNKFL